ncbi:helix-turn-helix domain-containing protein [Marinilabilia rubra]|uniref:XRE family transcriptional regulator n=1 Tax=Marinilabilia rubra TaxID=2162893 RepID=A0A2U2B6W3_9BACT|nr:helix-turn-helix transcriptional regulator [Marinilabilia rubra]PWD98774.1 XRE family transcriptional regulator [Marinilabilia rubra]
MKEIIGKNIANLRNIQGLTQDNLAAYLGVSRVQISHYERGERDISVTELNKLADLFGVELSDLLEENLEMQKLNLAFAFRSKNTESDLEYIASFKKVVRNYLKMERLENAL